MTHTMLTPKSKNMTEERAIGSRNRHVRGIGQAFVEGAHRFAAAQREERTVTEDEIFNEEEPAQTARPATDGMLRFVWSLATYRDMPEHVRSGALMMIEDHRAGSALFSFDVARAFIEKYKNAGQRKREARPAQSTSTVDRDGMYRDPESGTIYKVQFNRASGDGRRLYAKALVVVTEPQRDESGKIVVPAEVRFDYAPGAMRLIRPEWRMSKDDALRFGALYGTCVRCGRTLTLEESIERAMGRVCASAENW